MISQFLITPICLLIIQFQYYIVKELCGIT